MNASLHLASCLLLASLPTAEQSLVGSWEGTIESAGTPLRTVLHLELDSEGRLMGTLDSPEQNGFGFGVAEVVHSGVSLSFQVPDTHGAWAGRFDPDSGRLIGTWKQRGAELPLEFERVEVDPLVGTWQGVGDFGAVKLRLVFHVGTRIDGTLGASLVSPDQSPAFVPVSRVERGEDGSLRLEIASIGATFEGTPDAAAMRIEGHLLQGGGRFALVLEKSRAPTAPNRPQTPRPPFPYRVEEVSYANPRAGNRLAGSLTLPPEGGPFPALLLITGSGSQNRDEELFGHKPFAVLADHLTRDGLAVLRVDDRGVGGSSGDVASATSADFATDVAAGVEFLHSRPDIRADRIGLLGHSEGGLIGPLVAVERGDIAFLVLLAGPGIRGDELLYLQAALLARAAGASEEAVAENRRLQERLFAVLLGDSDLAQARSQIEEILRGTGSEDVEASLRQIASPWFRFFVREDPAATLRRVRCPVLALNGALDLQVPARENLDAIAAALEAGGNPDYQVKEYPGLNHLFQHAQKGTVAEYAELEETLAPEVLADIAAWIRARTDD